jgi:RHS repeat-associated protein
MFFQETGLHYNYYRDYDPATGRYAQSDPIGLRGGLNTYGYVSANSVMSIDPLGLSGIAGVVRPWWSLPGSGSTARPYPYPTVTDPAVPIPDVNPDVSTPGDPNNCNPCEGLRQQLLKHEKKLADYINDPLQSAMMSRGILWMAYLFNEGSRAQSIHEGRLRELRKQVDTFRRDYEACLIRHNLIG